ncbi:hypothetical protein LY78DRAFT_662279 [Colletotrichum sublineola]|nr:hypothetical protein LY78DRAFT_662279 [Colletotrichum sublineola]
MGSSSTESRETSGATPRVMQSVRVYALGAATANSLLLTILPRGLGSFLELTGSPVG